MEVYFLNETYKHRENVKVYGDIKWEDFPISEKKLVSEMNFHSSMK